MRAHTGGRHLRQLTFMTHDVLHPGLVEAFYPELAPEWVAWNLMDLVRGVSTQTALKGRDRVHWAWDGKAMVTTRNGVPYVPRFGIAREQHMIVNRWLFWPVETLRGAPAEMQLLPPVEGRRRIGIAFTTPPYDSVVLEVDSSTGLAHALTYTAKATPLRGTLRAEFTDYRDVGDGVWVAHRIVETLPVGGVGMSFHDVTLWDVEAVLDAAQARGDSARGSGRARR